jgi:hypothetical protein
MLPLSSPASPLSGDERLHLKLQCSAAVYSQAPPVPLRLAAHFLPNRLRAQWPPLQAFEEFEVNKVFSRTSGFFSMLETGFCCVAEAGLELLGSSEAP